MMTLKDGRFQASQLSVPKQNNNDLTGSKRAFGPVNFTIIDK